MTHKHFDYLGSHFQQIESQVQFGDSKASLLVAGNAILLAVSGSLVKMLSGCLGNEFTISCMEMSWSLSLSISSGVMLMISVVLSLLAARPAKIHGNPNPELFLLSYIATLDRDEFVKDYIDTTPDELTKDALKCIYGKSVFAAKKFRLLKWAIDTTILSLVFIVISLIFAVAGL